MAEPYDKTARIGINYRWQTLREHPLRIAVLTSSRADYGIYRPLLRRMQADPDIALHIMAFGTHLSRFHGYTLDHIRADGFEPAEEVSSLLLTDTAEAISTAMGLTLTKFAAVWTRWKTELDLVLCLGDRYEMFAAVAASLPFGLPIAHIHGGETSLGAIDNTFRHALSHMAMIHFTSTEAYANRVRQLVDDRTHIYNVGSLSLDNLRELDLLSPAAFLAQYGIDLTQPTILMTFHPETVGAAQNSAYAKELSAVLRTIEDYQVLITMPNADTLGTVIREALAAVIAERAHVIGVESLGTLGYFSAMKHCAFLLGNSSSGIIEAASFGKYVINLGKRQNGRATSDNILHVPIEREAISKAIQFTAAKGTYDGSNIYYQSNTTDKVLSTLKQIFA